LRLCKQFPTKQQKHHNDKIKGSHAAATAGCGDGEDVDVQCPDCKISTKLDHSGSSEQGEAAGSDVFR
jgi:hypothetical protein